MADFPTIVTTNGDPTSANFLSNPAHSLEHQSHNAEIKATQTKIGTGASTPNSGKVLRATGTGTSSWSQVDVTTDVGSFTSANLRTLISDETGTGVAVFGTSPTISGAQLTASPTVTTPNIITSINDTNSNELFKFTATGSAVNEVTMANAATGNSPSLTASGGDSNIDIKFVGKGTGKAYTDNITETAFDYVVSGLVITADSAGVNKNYSISAGIAYISGVRVTVAAVSAQTVTASKDRYIDLTSAGALSTTGGEVNNNAASPALAAGSLRIGIVVAGATTIAAAASINQGQEDRVLPIASSIAYSVTDSLGNLICPRDPNRKILGYRQIISTITTSSTSAVQATGLTAPVIVPTGRKVKITISGGTIGPNTNSKNVFWEVWSGVVSSGTRVGGTYFTQANANFACPTTFEAINTPSVNSVTYNMGYYTDSSATVSLNATATSSVFIKVELA